MNSKEKVQIHKGMDKVKSMHFDEALNIFEGVWKRTQLSQKPGTIKG